MVHLFLSPPSLLLRRLLFHVTPTLPSHGVIWFPCAQTSRFSFPRPGLCSAVELDVLFMRSTASIWNHNRPDKSPPPPRWPGLNKLDQVRWGRQPLHYQANERQLLHRRKDTEGAVGTWEKGNNNEFIDNFSKFNILGPTPPSEFLFLMPGTMDYFAVSHLSKPPFLFPLVCMTWGTTYIWMVPDLHL